MKKIVLLLLVTMVISYVPTQAQTLTIKNQTCYDLIYYSGSVLISGVNYTFGNEIDPCGVIPNSSNITSDMTMISSCTPGVSGPTSFIGFKIKDTTYPATISTYISAANPYVVVTPLASGCNGLNPITIVWTGTASNPTVWILP